jgi:Sulfotransferase domain
MTKPARLILVTGTPRSGTTALGHHLALGKGVRTLYEPFGIYAGMVEIKQYFEIPGTQSFTTQQLDECITKLQTLNLNLNLGIYPKNKGWMRSVKSIFGGRSQLYYRLCKADPFLHTIIWKDPFACFATDYITAQHDVDAIVTYRNPWAVAASFKRLNWSFDLENLQARLNELNLSVPGLHQIAHNKDSSEISSSVENGSMLWHIIHSVLLGWKMKNPKINFVNLDNLISDPIAAYKIIYNAVELDFSPQIENKIKTSYSKSSNKIQPSDRRVHDWNRDLSKINQYWKNLLTQSEIDLIHNLNNDLWKKLQPECLLVKIISDKSSPIGQR